MALPAEDGGTFVWGSNGAQLTPEQIAARRKVADALAVEAGDASPIRSAWQGVARLAKGVSAGLDYRAADSADRTNAAANKEMISALLSGGGGSPAVAAVPADASAPVAALTPAPVAADTSGKVYRNDESSPLDPPSGADRDALIRTVYGEAGNESPLGQQAVASVIRNRAIDGGYGGDTPSAVVRAPNQFEPWNGGPARDRMLALSPNDPKYQAISKVVDAAYGADGRAPEDPTEGMTHFYSPAGQAALGRKPPAWAGGESVTIGGHVFNSPDDAAAKPAQVASGDPAAIPANATPAQGYAVPGQPAPIAAPASPGVAKVSGALAGVNPAVLAAVTSPYASESTKKIAGIMLQAQLGKEKKDTYSEQKDADGNVWSVNNTTGQRTVALKNDSKPFSQPYRDADGNLVQRGADGKVAVVSAAEKTPNSVQEYKFYKDNFQPTDQTKVPMDYATWSTSKARAGATTVNNNIGGGSDKQIFDAFDERAKEARSTAVGLVALRNARQALQGDGGAVTGFGANERLSLQKAGAYLGVTDPKAIQNTETFRAAIAPQVASVLKSTVGTANISNSDREFAEKAAGGSIVLDGGSINRLLDIMEKASIARLQSHQEQLDAVYPDPVANKRERALFGINVPTQDAPPAGATKSGIKWSVE